MSKQEIVNDVASEVLRQIKIEQAKNAKEDSKNSLINLDRAKRFLNSSFVASMATAASVLIAGKFMPDVWNMASAIEGVVSMVGTFLIAKTACTGLIAASTLGIEKKMKEEISSIEQTQRLLLEEEGTIDLECVDVKDE